MKRGQARAVTILLAAALLAGCAATRAHKGAVLDTQLVSSIQPGIDNKASVEKLLGRPTMTGQFSPNDWYYVSRDTVQVAFRNPRISKQTVLHVSFNQAGTVAAVNRTGRELVLALDPANRKTPTLGRKRSLFDELFGNIGTVGSVGNQPPGY